MVTMIIVEDESFERNALKQCIDWNLIGVEIVGEASNGAHGLSLALEKRPDIVLTDVCMPVMNAIEMSKNLRTIMPETKIIFISSYDDFEYARQGISLNIFAYVTKPVKEDELLRTVKKAVDEITERKMEKKIYSKIKNNYEINVQLARQALIYQLLFGISADLDHLDHLGLSWLWGDFGYRGIFLCVPESPENCDRAVWILESMKVPGALNSLVTRAGNGRIAVIVLWENAPGEDLVEGYMRQVRDFFGREQIVLKRMERAVAKQENENIRSLYEEIMKKSISFAGGKTEVTAEKKRNRHEIVETLEEIIRTHYRENLSIESIAKMMHFTPNYIGTVFKAEKKEGINHYLLKVRLEAAKRMLLSTELPINEIAMECGYENVTYFHTIFKKEFGMTPNEFRLQGRENCL